MSDAAKRTMKTVPAMLAGALLWAPSLLFVKLLVPPFVWALVSGMLTKMVLPTASA